MRLSVYNAALLGERCAYRVRIRPQKCEICQVLGCGRVAAVKEFSLQETRTAHLRVVFQGDLSVFRS